ncbi:MAG: rcsC [Myxococcaceae bacterium]|nr:rcsC [Myxococcaceae bacterium]
MSSESDQRDSLRVPFILRVDYPDHRSFSDATENLSKGGLFIQTDWKAEVGAFVPLSLSFPGLLDPVEIVGRVAWVRTEQAGGRGAGVGIAVDSENHRKHLERLLTIEAHPPAGPQAPPAGGFRVLIVEDNPHIIEMYSYVLKKLAANELKGTVPLEVHFAPDGHNALNQLMASPFNLVMTDLYMPVMDGFQLLEKIRAEPTLAKMPVVAISAGGRDAQERALKLGVDIYLRKPVKFAEVLETVKQLLRIK